VSLRGAPPPAPVAAPRVAAEPRRPLPAAEGASVILLVEDETGVRSLFARDLRNRGYEVLEAESGEDGLEILEQEGQRIDLLLSDVQMPGMNGPTMLRRLGDRRPEMRVIFMSGFTSEAFAETLESAFDAPREYGFLTKPVSLAQLRARVEKELTGA
jgi:two-component system cell cycle sensor histidine kinase/response regulator CckA